jgi:RHS repeat-associated protein
VNWALGDQQGTIRTVLSAQGNTVNEILYDAFGGVTAESNSNVDFRFLFTGQELDSETGNYFYNTRFYEPTNGVFIQQDKIGFAGGDTNLYRYVFNSPTNYTDPSGNFPVVPLVNFGVGFLVDSAIQVAVNRGFDNYDWKQATMTGLSSAVGGPLAGKIMGKTAPFWKKLATSAAVSGFVDGGLQLGRNVLEGKCDVWEGVGQQAIAGAVGGVLGEGVDAGLKHFFKSPGAIADNALKNGDDVSEQVQKKFVECLVAGTLIATPIGFIPIEEIQVGDKVYGGTKEYPGGIFRVRQLYQRQVNRVMDIVVDGVTITCTPEHPFWVEGYGWVLAKDLEPGYWLLTKDGLNLPIDSVIWHEGEETVYNFEMDEYHTYYVSPLALLSHNMCGYANISHDGDDLIGVPTGRQNIHLELAERSKQLRDDLIEKPIGTQNVASARLELDNGNVLYKDATSTNKGPLPDRPATLSDDNGLFDPTYDRISGRVMDTDSEFKLFDYLARELNKLPESQRSGTLDLFTEQDMCGSCFDLKGDFERMFGNKIKVNVSYKLPYP